MRLSLANPLEKIQIFTTVLKRANIAQIRCEDRFVNRVLRYDPKEPHVGLSDEFKATLYPLFMNPTDYQKNGYFKDWYNFHNYNFTNKFYGSHLTNTKVKKIVIDRLDNQMKYIEWVKRINQVDFNEKDIENYLKFMFLLKKNKGAHLVPTLSIDTVWHAHMLDNRTYCRDTREYFGHVLIHDDTIPTTRLDEYLHHTNNVWRKEYGTTYIPSIALGLLSTQAMHTENDKNKSKNGGSACCVTDNLLLNNSNRDSSDSSDCSNRDSSDSSDCSGGCGSSCGGDD
jgi:hypothetical protein